MICVAVTYTIKEGHEDEAIEFFKKLTERTEAEPGNLMYLAHRSPDNPRRFFLYEQYTSQAGLDAHRDSEHFKQYALGGLYNIFETREAVIYEPLD